MLTAYTLEEQKIKGYECGADSYISKPFSANLLKVRLHNLLENHRRVQNFFADKPAVQKEGLNQVDQGFISKLRQLIDEELGNSEVSVEDLGASLGLGRVQLYRFREDYFGSNVRGRFYVTLLFYEVLQGVFRGKSD